MSDIAKLRLSNCQDFVLVDADMVGALTQWKWRKGSHGYVIRSIYNGGKPKEISMHRQLMGFPEGLEVDHINGNKLDNRMTNLRVATHSQNEANKPARSNTGYKGVSKNKHSLKYQAYIHIDGKMVHLGLYSCVLEAAAAYNKAAAEHFGEFAFLNDANNPMRAS